MVEWSEMWWSGVRCGGVELMWWSEMWWSGVRCGGVE